MTPEEYRAAVRRTVQGQRLGEIVDRWFQGAPVDLLAAELGVPRDALWEVLEPAIEARRSQAEHRDPRKLPPLVPPAALAERPQPTRGLRRPVPAATAPASGVDCIGPTCPYRCTSVCGRITVDTNGTPRG